MQKNIIIILFLIFSFSSKLISQDFEPSQRTFTIGGTSGQYLDNSNNYFKINNFLLGWHWGEVVTAHQIPSMGCGIKWKVG